MTGYPPINFANALGRLIAIMIVVAGWTIFFPYAIVETWPLLRLSDTQTAIVAAALFALPFAARFRYAYSAFAPVYGWYAFVTGRMRWLPTNFVLSRESHGVWAIHEQSSVFLGRTPPASPLVAFRQLAAAFAAGSFSEIEAVSIPAGFLSREELIRFGFEVNDEPITWMRRLTLWLAADELRARRDARQKWTRKIVPREPRALKGHSSGRISRDALVARFFKSKQRDELAQLRN